MVAVQAKVKHVRHIRLAVNLQVDAAALGSFTHYRNPYWMVTSRNLQMYEYKNSWTLQLNRPSIITSLRLPVSLGTNVNLQSPSLSTRNYLKLLINGNHCRKKCVAISVSKTCKPRVTMLNILEYYWTIIIGDVNIMLSEISESVFELVNIYHKSMTSHNPSSRKGI